MLPAPGSELPPRHLTLHQPPGAKRVTSAHGSEREPSPFEQQLGDAALCLGTPLQPRQGTRGPLGLAAHEGQEVVGGGEY